MTATPVGPADHATSPTTSDPEELVRGLTEGWNHRGDELDSLLDRVCSRLAQEANHELRQILTLLSTELELANLRRTDGFVELDADRLARLLDALDRGSRILGTYLSRNEAAKLLIRLDREPVDLARLGQSILVREGIDPRNGPADVALDGVLVSADREKLETGLGNLAGRFWQTRPAGGEFRFEVGGDERRAEGFVGLEPAPMSRGELVGKLEASLEIQTMGIDVPYVRAVLERHEGTLYVDRRDGATGYGFELPTEPPGHEVFDP